MPATALDLLCINTVRTLSMDAVQQADSGHPGTPMALAPLGYVLFTRTMRFDPADPAWPNRDRFILSCGHASMLLYSCLYLTGYDLTLEDIKQFRQWGSKTPGHPEHGHTPGVETTTGPLGQGTGNAVGMAVAEAHLAAAFNKPGQEIVDHYTFFICSDGDLMEGISHEAASFAGHFKLGKLIGFYDDNHITIDGKTELTFTDDTAKRFEAYAWQVLHIADVNDLDAIEGAIAEAKDDAERPTLIITRTHIGYGSPRQDSEKAHGEALGKENVVITKQNYGWPTLDTFYVPADALAEWRKAKDRGASCHAEWNARWKAYAAANPADAAELERRLAGRRPENWEAKLPTFTAENGAIATRAAFGAALNATADLLPELVGGSADLTPSNNTSVKAWQNFTPESRGSRYVHFGIREHGMASIMTGMALHGGVLPYGGTFLIFSDYMRPSVRLAALMGARVIYVYTHDSIGLGEDGPTHQPIEQLSSLRAIPGLTVVRPADANETAVGPRRTDPHATKASVHRPLEARRGGRIDAGRVRPRRPAGRRRAARRAHGVRFGGATRCRGPDAACRPRCRGARRVHAIHGSVRASAGSVPGRGASAGRSARSHRSRAADVVVSVGRVVRRGDRASSLRRELAVRAHLQGAGNHRRRRRRRRTPRDVRVIRA
jgi:transketolase